jgi:hypothetical protein
MKVVSSLAWLSAVSTLRSTFAFSIKPTASSATSFTSLKLSNSNRAVHTTSRTASSALNMVAASSSPLETTASVAKMERGVGGRIEEAFAQSKERGEAAFVTFVTAGYPTAQGT